MASSLLLRPAACRRPVCFGSVRVVNESLPTSFLVCLASRGPAAGRGAGRGPSDGAFSMLPSPSGAGAATTTAAGPSGSSIFTRRDGAPIEDEYDPMRPNDYEEVGWGGTGMRGSQATGGAGTMLAPPPPRPRGAKGRGTWVEGRRWVLARVRVRWRWIDARPDFVRQLHTAKRRGAPWALLPLAAPGMMM